jgi:hypothetical protein
VVNSPSPAGGGSAMIVNIPENNIMPINTFNPSDIFNRFPQWGQILTLLETCPPQTLHFTRKSAINSSYSYQSITIYIK